MNCLRLIKRSGEVYLRVARRFNAASTTSTPSEAVSENVIDPPDTLQLANLNYDRRCNDHIDTKKARLLYQSRKRGNLENGIILSTFAAKYLETFNEDQINEYDKIINLPSNDWDIFYWAMGMKPVPKEFDNGVMKLLKDHLKTLGTLDNVDQPPLP